MYSPRDVGVTPLEEVAALAPNQFQLDFGLAMLGDKLLRAADHVGIESAGQAAIGRDDQQQNPLLGPPGQQFDLFVSVLLGRGLRHIRQHALDDLRVGPGRQHAILRAPQLGRRDHFHGLGDLLRVFHRANAPA